MTEGSSQSNQYYADKLIEFLQKRNRTLGWVWPLLLVLAVVTSGLALYYFQLNMQSQLQTEEVAAEKIQLQTALDAKDNEYKSLESEYESLQAEIQQLSQNQAALDSEQADKLDLTTKMVETLKANVTALEEEISARENEAALLKEALDVATASQSEKDLFVKRNTEKLNALQAQEADLKSKLNARKTAYTALTNRHKETKQEMERLSSQLSKTSAELASKDKNLDSLRKQLVVAQQELGQVKAEYRELEQNLSNIVAPIKAKPRVQSPPESNERQVVSVPKEQESKQETNSVGSASFDFDRVTIDRP